MNDLNNINDSNNMLSKLDDSDSDSDNDIENRADEAKSPENVIDNIYRSLSKIVEALNMDNIIMNKQLIKIKNELEYVCSTVSNIKEENQSIINTYSYEINNILEQIQKLTEHQLGSNVTSELNTMKTLITSLKTDIDLIQHTNKTCQTTTTQVLDLKKQILDTRTMLIQMINMNANNVKKEIQEIRKIKDDLTPCIRTIIAEEMKEHIAKMPSITQKFEELAREHRATLSQHIRKSTVQRINGLQVDTGSLLDMIKQQIKETDKTSDIEQLKKQQRDFMLKIEQMMVQVQEKIHTLT